MRAQRYSFFLRQLQKPKFSYLIDIEAVLQNTNNIQIALSLP
jgi:hypothetical protein